MVSIILSPVKPVTINDFGILTFDHCVFLLQIYSQQILNHWGFKNVSNQGGVETSPPPFVQPLAWSGKTMCGILNITFINIYFKV